MKFLTKFGQIALQIAQIAIGIQPLVGSFVKSDKGLAVANKVIDTLEQVAEIIGTVEVIGQALQLPGQQKLTAATPLVAQAIIKSALVANHPIKDPVLFSQGCEKIASGMADILNSRGDADIETLKPGSTDIHTV